MIYSCKEKLTTRIVQIRTKILADEGFVQRAVESGPGTLLVIIEGEAIHVLLVAGLIAIPVREAETLQGKKSNEGRRRRG